ncbi:MAG TPA: nucleoside recognition domain-containing protein [Bacillota bacterium]|jgi:spore maturation protein A|nr:nucleoside recognition domain-containing protein [Bacillota bacterium]HOP70889.1 nucleoside recognition domain-containing protein [Bacillota bacterium]HPZ86315.1 nucleoside recognition domain-containing protein [Bacillota bacterium]
MINYIWAGMLIIGFVVGAATGNLEAVTKAAIDNAQSAFELSLGLVGVMSLWLGLMRIAEESGIVEKLARALKPVTVRLFPDVPPEHPAMGAMIMNLAANVLGLGDAATPLGLKAMQELQKLNPVKDTATDAMCMFLAINTSSVTLISATTVAVLAAAGSANPTEIIGPTIIATACSTTVGIIAAKLLSKLPRFRMQANPGEQQEG